jgi:hypothetical protein
MSRFHPNSAITKVGKGAGTKANVTKRIDNIAAHADFKMLRGVHFVNALDSRRVVRVIESVYRNVTVPTTEPNNIVIPSVVHAQ